MQNKTKLHLANGTVYLVDGWTNIDVNLPGSYLAPDRPDLVTDNSTTVDNYYKSNVQRDDFLSGRFHKKEVVCDKFSDIRELPYNKGSVDEILAVQVFEHFTFKDGRSVFGYWTSLLKKGGILRLDVPDLKGTVQMYLVDPEWGTRLLFGSQKNEYGIHKSMYDTKSLRKLFEEFGYKDIEELPNIHTYPAFGMKGVKR